MRNQVTLRELGLEDIAHICKLIDIENSTTRKELNRVGRNIGPLFYKEIPPPPSDTIFFAIVSGEGAVVGIRYLRTEMAETGVFVLPMYRRQGYSKASLRKTVEYVRDHTPLSEIRVYVSRKNESAALAAISCGFNLCGSTTQTTDEEEHVIFFKSIVRKAVS